MTTAARFAPSPEGAFHLGDARAAVLNFLFARKHQGRFVLRIDDIGREPAPRKFAREIEHEMAWLGLDWDIFARQSERLALYAGAAERLKAARRLYPCFDTVEEPPHWRFKLAPGGAGWEDLIAGPIAVADDPVADPMLVRADGTPIALFASVVDDLDLGITHVIRGADHRNETAVQIQIFAALGFSAPAFAHVPMPAPFARVTIARLRDDGIEPMAINSLLATLGTGDPPEPRLRLDELVAAFDLAKFDRAPLSIDRAALDRLNGGLLRLMTYDAVAHRLPEGADRDFWDVVRPWLAHAGDVAEWWRVCRGPLKPQIAAEDRDFLAEAARLLSREPPDAFDRWIAALELSAGRSREALLLLLRRALTARIDGPALGDLLALIGRERVARRLRGEVA